MLISGRRDNVVTPAMSKELLTQAAKRNASVISDDGFAHPFNHQQRMKIIEQFLLRQETD
jgi:fermentation-respiration switch protein FrsA (DUF1100 family)